VLNASSRVVWNAKHVEVATSPACIRAFIALRNLDLRSAGESEACVGHANSNLSTRASFGDYSSLAIRRSPRATLVEVFIPVYCWSSWESFRRRSFGAVEHQIEASDDRGGGLGELSRLIGFSEKPVEHAARIRSAGRPAVGERMQCV